MAMSRQERVALHTNQKRMQFGSDMPNERSLVEGKPEYRETSKGLYQYIKYNNEVYSRLFTRNTKTLEEEINDTVNNITINEITISGILDVSSGGTGASSLTSNAVLTGTGTSAITAEGNLSFNGSTLAVTGALTTTTNLSVGDDLSLTSDSAVFNMGDDSGFSITHDGDIGATIAGSPVTITAAEASTWSTSTGALTLTSAAAATWSASAGNLTIDSAAGTLVLDGHTGITLDASNSGNVEINVTAGDDILIGNDAVAVDVKLGQAAATEVELTALLIDINGGSSIRIDAAGASNFSTTSGGLTLTGAAASTWSTTSGALTVDSVASTLTLDGHTGVTVQSSNSGDITLDSVTDIELNADGGNVIFKDGTQQALNIDMDDTAGDAVFKDASNTEIFRIDGSENIIRFNSYAIDNSDPYPVSIKPANSTNHITMGQADKQNNYSMIGIFSEAADVISGVTADAQFDDWA